MPLQKLQFRPGINREGTTLSNEGGWFYGDKIRFRSGQVEKLGGWVLDTGKTNSFGAIQGAARALWNWVSLSNFNYMAVGTNSKLYIQSSTNGTYYDVTPIRKVTSPGTVTFAAANGSKTVVVTNVAHGAQTGDFINFSGVAAGGLGGAVTQAILQQTAGFKISYLTSSTFSIQVPVAANASDVGNGGGSVVGTYQITSGNDIYTFNFGWGTGGWGGPVAGGPSTTLNGAISNSATTITVVSTTGFATTGSLLIDSETVTYTGISPTTFTGCVRGINGTGSGAAAAHSSGTAVQQSNGYTGWGGATGIGVGVQLRLWSLGNFGQNLLANPRGGPIYYWVPDSANPTSVYNVAQVLSSGNTNTQNGTQWWLADADTPLMVNYVLVSDASRFTIALGTNDYGSTIQNPLLVRWSDQESVTTWTPAVTNQAGSYQLSHGSAIINAIQSRQEILIWTDAALYSMQYLGAPFVWGFNLLADNVSIISPNAAAVASNVTYWMGQDKFYMYSGRTETLPSTLRQYVFQDLNATQAYQFFAGTNEGFNEIWWFYCSADSNYVNRYVIYNHLERIWYYGNLGRTAWLDSALRATPTAANYVVGSTDTSNLIYHENGVNNGEVNPPAAINSFVQSSDFDIGDGHNFGFVWRIIPDVSFDGSENNNPSLSFTVLPRQNPGANYGTDSNPIVSSKQNYQNKNTYEVQQFTEYAYVRMRGRQMAFKIESNDIGTQWQLGVPRLDIKPDGRR